MQSYNEFSAVAEAQGPTPINEKRHSEPIATTEEEIGQLEGIFQKLVSDGKISRKQLIQKLLQIEGKGTSSSQHEELKSLNEVRV